MEWKFNEILIEKKISVSDLSRDVAQKIGLGVESVRQRFYVWKRLNDVPTDKDFFNRLPVVAAAMGVKPRDLVNCSAKELALHLLEASEVDWELIDSCYEDKEISDEST